MTDPNPKETLRQFREYFAGANEARGKLAARIGISNLTLADMLAGSRQPMAKTMAKLRAFLDAEAK
jgi:transcriptional regulator with XRE-family HTH domain